MIKNVFAGILCLLALDFTNVNAQQDSALKIGMSIPQFEIRNVYNFNSEEINLNDFKGKVIILDFWSVGCAPCLAALPKMDSLQAVFKDRVKIITVNKSPLEKIVKDYRPLQGKTTTQFILQKLLRNLTTITSDTLFNNWFPHAGEPHCVWINKDGNYIGATGSLEVNSLNLHHVINTGKLQTVHKNDFLNYEHGELALPQFLKRDKNSLKFYTSIMKYQGGIAGGGKDIINDTLTNTTRFFKANRSILEFYGDIFSDGRIGDPFRSSIFDYGKRLQIISSKMDKFLPSHINSDSEWGRKNRFTYEAVLPIMPKKDLYKIFKSDMDKFFQINSRMEKQRLKAIIITFIGDSSKLAFKGDIKSVKFLTKYEDGKYILDGGFMETFRSALSKNNQNEKFIFVDETGYKGRIHLELGLLTNLKLLNIELKEKYNLELRQEERVVDVLILEDRN